jgi:hypothetical protein
MEKLYHPVCIFSIIDQRDAGYLGLSLRKKFREDLEVASYRKTNRHTRGTASIPVFTDLLSSRRSLR